MEATIVSTPINEPTEGIYQKLLAIYWIYVDVWMHGMRAHVIAFILMFGTGLVGETQQYLWEEAITSCRNIIFTLFQELVEQVNPSTCSL